MIQIPYGNDFSLRYIVTTINYVGEETIVENYDLTQAQNVSVFLHCDKHDINIPLQWHIEDNTNNVIIADVVGSQLEVGSVYGTFITGQDDNNKNWRWSESGQNMFSVVEYTGNEDLGEYEDLQNIDVKVGLVGLNGHQGEQGVQGSQGEIGMQGSQGEQGVQGSQGNVGVQGSQGEIGIQGSQGRKGDDGAQGVQGQRGEKGYQGEAGVQGIQGRKGDTGVQGEIGEKGVQGDTGFQGVIGEQGSQGSQGDTGVQGTAGIGFRLGEDNQYYVDNHVHVTNGDGLTFSNEEHPWEEPSGSILFASKEMGLDYPQVAINVKGLNNVEGSIYANDYHYYDEIGGSTKSIKNRINDLRTRISTLEESGVQGPQGNKGADGYQGIDGQQGAQGRKGDDGAQGVQGQRGEKGYQGEAGVQGIQGRKGDIGVQGSQGSKGADGTMYFDDLTPEQKASLKGDQGVQGVKGSQGEQGIQGQRGEKGYQGEAGTGAQGVKGSQGDQGVQGAKGDTTGILGAQGNQGTQGEQGDRGPQGYGAASPAAEFPKVFLVRPVTDDQEESIYINLNILCDDHVYYTIQSLFWYKFNLMEEIRSEVVPDNGAYSTNHAYAVLVYGDFDNMLLVSDSNGIRLQKTINTTKMPTWVAIYIRCKAQLFNIDCEHIGSFDEIALMSYTHIDLSQAPWNQNI